MSSKARASSKTKAGSRKKAKKTSHKKNADKENTNVNLPGADVMFRVLGECQGSVAAHNRGLTSMMKVMEKLGSMEDFMKIFIPALNRILVVFKREPAVERLVKFISVLATNDKTKNPTARDQFLDAVLRCVSA